MNFYPANIILSDQSIKEHYIYSNLIEIYTFGNYFGGYDFKRQTEADMSINIDLHQI